MLQQIELQDGVQYIPPKRKRGRPFGTGKKNKPEKQAIGRPGKNVGSITVNTTLVFHLNKESEAQIIINRGSARSSKSYSIMQLLVEWFFTIPKIKILILRKTQPALRTSVRPLINEIIDLYNLRSRIIEVKADNNLWSPVKGMIHFGGLDDPEKIKSSDWSVVFMEEATEFDYQDFLQLKLRLSTPTYQDFRNKVILSFNPIDEFHWIKEKVLNNATEDVCEIHSTYRLNPFLNPDYVKTIEALEFQDENYYRIFAEGQWGRLENIIFSNWITVPEMPVGEEIYGLDFGFINPSSLVRVRVDGLEAGVECLLSQSGLTNSDLIVQLNRLLTPEQKAKSIIFADAAEPQRIQEIKDAGFWIMAADKSVKDGIDYTKRHHLKILEDSDVLIKEIRGYSYRSDKNGRVLEEPIKFNDHCLDALRYALYTNWINTSRNIPNIKTLNWNDSQSRNEWGEDDY
mgnify:CR=1 FL=1